MKLNKIEREVTRAMSCVLHDIQWHRFNSQEELETLKNYVSECDDYCTASCKGDPLANWIESIRQVINLYASTKNSTKLSRTEFFKAAKGFGIFDDRDYGEYKQSEFFDFNAWIRDVMSNSASS